MLHCRASVCKSAERTNAQKRSIRKATFVAHPLLGAEDMDLDAWLAEHIGCEQRRAEVRANVDCLSDFRVASLEDLEDALGLAAWPALSKIRFLNAWRRLKDGEDASSEPQRPRSAAELAGSTRAREPSSGIA